MKTIQIWTLVRLVVVISAIVLLAQGHAVPLDYFKAFSYVVSGVSFALLLWERWLWSWWLFRPWLTTRPDMRGTWKGDLVSSWVDPVTKQGRGEIEAYLVIRQTYSTIDVRLLTAESGSISLSASIVDDSQGVNTLAVVYRNTPRVLLRSRSPIGHGGMLLYLSGSPVHQLHGEYWTDRNTKGELTLGARSREHFHDYDQAAKAAYITVRRTPFSLRRGRILASPTTTYRWPGAHGLVSNPCFVSGVQNVQLSFRMPSTSRADNILDSEILACRPVLSGLTRQPSF